MKRIILSILFVMLFLACKTETNNAIKNTEQPKDEIKSTKNLKDELVAEGYEIIEYVDEKTKDTVLMQQYFIAFLKSGPNRTQSEKEANTLQEQHMAHLREMYELGYADISGPFADDSDIKGITIYNVPTIRMADSLANADPMVKAGRLSIEIHPWWAAKGFSLR